MRRYRVVAGVVAVVGLVIAFLAPIGRDGHTNEAAPGPAPPAATPVHQYRVVKAYPHDRQAFTQGLLYLDGKLYESTGLKGQSTLREVALETGTVIRQRQVGPEFFAEGLSDWSTTLIQLTWTSGVAIVYDRATFRETGRFSYTGEGWGLTRTGTHLLMSNGSATISVLDPATFRVTRSLDVHDEHGPVSALNELEMMRGTLLANVWQSQRVAMIAPDTGRVTGWIDFTGLLPASELARVDVMNGIAYDERGDRLFVTGKWWPTLYQVEIVR